MLEAAFGPTVGVRVSELTHGLDVLLPAERALARRFADPRLREFATGRALARELLEEASVGSFELLPDDERVPRWPNGFIGSISHTRALCAAALAPISEYAGLALDLEDAEPISPELFGTLLTPREQRDLDVLPAADRGLRARAIFSAKECVHKAQFPSARIVLDFLDVEVSLDARRGTFRALCNRELGRIARRGEPLDGACAIASGQIVCALAVRTGRA